MTDEVAGSRSQLSVERVVLGIDPGTATTGYGVVAQSSGDVFALLACGVIRTSPQEEMPRRLLELHRDVEALIAEFQPDEMAVEKLFFGRNVTTAISVGQARGAVLLAAAEHGLPVAEYTPAEIKQAIAGYGNAEKGQVQEMVRRLLRLSDVPRPDDAADGAAIAVCHLQSMSYRALLAE